MSSTSSSSSIRSKNPRIFRLGTNGRVYCNHELVAIRRGSDCKFFMWKQEVGVVLLSECNCHFVEMDNERLVFEKTLIEEENKSLKKPSKKPCFVVIVCIAAVLFWLY
ncbi:putative actin-crosslinking [Helianthus anomalus]